jgi:hypothetical protein
MKISLSVITYNDNLQIEIGQISLTSRSLDGAEPSEVITPHPRANQRAGLSELVFYFSSARARVGEWL